MWLLYRSQYWHAVEYNFLLGSDNSIFEKKKKRFKKWVFFAFISFTDKKFWNEKLFMYLVVSCKWPTLSLLIWWNSWNNLLVLYTCIILYFEKKVPTAMVNTSTLYQQNKQPPLFQISEYKKDHIIWIWKSRSWSGTDTKIQKYEMWWVMFLRCEYNLVAMVNVRYI
jgi:hypothetical protein